MATPLLQILVPESITSNRITSNRMIAMYPLNQQYRHVRLQSRHDKFNLGIVWGFIVFSDESSFTFVYAHFQLTLKLKLTSENL